MEYYSAIKKNTFEKETFKKLPENNKASGLNMTLNLLMAILEIGSRGNNVL